MFFISSFLTPSSYLYAGNASILVDVQDPLFLNRQADFVTRTSVDVGNFFRARQGASIGLNDRLTLSADIQYRVGDDHFNDGFSNFGFLGTYRFGQGSTGVTDILFGLGYGPHDLTPGYSDHTYRIGFRTGKQWESFTLAVGVMTNWIFHETHGQAYIDLTPEAYIRLRGGYRTGFGAILRKSTMVGAYDQTWLNYMFGTVIGQTGWFLNIGYELNSEDIRIGGTLNMLF